MGLLDSLLGNTQKRDEYREYLDRYEKGEPWDGYSDREVVDRYEQVTSGMSREDYEEAATEAFERLSPQQRRQLLEHVRSRANERHLDMPQLNREYGDRDFEDPRELARITSGLQERQPGLLEQLLGGLGGGTRQEIRGRQEQESVFDNPLAKAALAGIAAMAVKRVMNRQSGGNLGTRINDRMI
ncbi:MAG: hypothetical protein ACYC4L_07435 [Chloroflexota bacterium]